MIFCGHGGDMAADERATEGDHGSGLWAWGPLLDTSPCRCSTLPAATSRPGLRLSRRAVLGGGVAAAAGTVVARSTGTSASAAAHRIAPRLALDGTSVVLLGTAGGPVPQWHRAMTSQAVVVNGYVYLVDCGNGVVRQIVNAGIPYQAIQALFITHLHPDHTFDYLPFMVCGRSIGPQPGFRRVVHTYGPARAGSLPPDQPNPGVTPISPLLPTPGLVDTHNRLAEPALHRGRNKIIPQTRSAVGHPRSGHSARHPYSRCGRQPRRRPVPGHEPFHCLRGQPGPRVRGPGPPSTRVSCLRLPVRHRRRVRRVLRRHHSRHQREHRRLGRRCGPARARSRLPAGHDRAWHPAATGSQPAAATVLSGRGARPLSSRIIIAGHPPFVRRSLPCLAH